jgi:hypothetical protein
MIGTLAWKEHREHQGIWLTMAVMTVAVGWGLPRIVSQGDHVVFMAVSLLTTLGMTVAYGVVCGAMMFAGEHEGGTLVFLDIFHGRRGRLWFGKAAVGTVLIITEALAVAAFLWWIGQEPPTFGPGFLNRPVAGIPGPAGASRLTANAWFAILPIVGLEAYAWGLFGSSLTRRALPGAAIGAVGASIAWMFTFCGVVFIVLVVRLTAAFIVLVFSWFNFVNQSKEATLGPISADVPPIELEDARETFLERYDGFARENELLRRWAERDRAERDPTADVMIDREVAAVPAKARQRRPLPEANADAASPREALRWLVLEQYSTFVVGMGFGCFVAGLIVAANAQVLWPFATLLVGVVCGVAAFAPEQRDLSYQFLAAQHFPLRSIWRFKILSWGAATVMYTMVVALGVLLASVLVRLPNQLGRVGFAGPLFDLLGPIAFFGIWPAYGFGVGQIVVWLCRKNILALLLSLLVAAGAIGLWLPSMIAGGMTGWQLWLTPAILIFAGWALVRAWAGGRITERKPVFALVGFISAALAWALVVFAHRAWEIPDVGPPIDVAAFRAGIPAKEDEATREIQQALAEYALNGDKALPLVRRHLRAASRLPPGVLETPRLEASPTLRHLDPAKRVAEALVREMRHVSQEEAANCLGEALTLSRSLRNMAPVESYLVGVEIERNALAGFETVLPRWQPTAETLQFVLDDLHFHADKTPPALDCARTECFRSSGMILDPQAWNLTAPDDLPAPGWLRGGVGLSLETPWESERKTRLWRLVWAGLLRGFDAPDWQRPEAAEPVATQKSAPRAILGPWLPGNDGVDRVRMTRLVDASWLADERLFCTAESLRVAALRSRVRVDTTRLAIAVALHRMEERQAPERLDDLAKRFPGQMPIDPYSGRPYGYDKGLATARIWSTGPDRVDDGGLRDGEDVPDDDVRWRTGKLDLVKTEPRWP